mmetsp:Transcript_16262/g.46492  ORF Transcript_16262/g.46492 Transcript_16262/m.46492 type:complete len:107 (+) Transcript_16262:95-415(+)
MRRRLNRHGGRSRLFSLRLRGSHRSQHPSVVCAKSDVASNTSAVGKGVQKVPAHQLDTEERHEELSARVLSDQSASPFVEILWCFSCKLDKRTSMCEGPRDTWQPP